MTKENAKEFVDLYIQYTFYKSCKIQFDAFKNGFCQIAPLTTIQNLLKPEEFEQLVIGFELLDFENIKANWTFKSGFHKNHHVVKWFFEVLEEMD